MPICWSRWLSSSSSPRQAQRGRALPKTTRNRRSNSWTINNNIKQFKEMFVWYYGSSCNRPPTAGAHSPTSHSGHATPHSFFSALPVITQLHSEAFSDLFNRMNLPKKLPVWSFECLAEKHQIERKPNAFICFHMISYLISMGFLEIVYLPRRRLRELLSEDLLVLGHRLQQIHPSYQLPR